MTGGEGHRAWSKKELGSQKRKENNFERMSVETFDEHYDAGTYTLKHHLLDHMSEARKIQSAICFRQRLYDHFNVHIKQMLRRALQRRRARMIETGHMMERN